MRHHTPSRHLPVASAPGLSATWRALQMVWPYLWRFPGRVILALVFLLCAKLANVLVPWVFKSIVDSLSSPHALLQVPVMLLAAYGVLRLLSSMFTELREFVFIRVTQQSMRRVAMEVFEHMHRLSLRFHLERQTDGLSRDIERGTRAVGSIIGYAIYSILPTLLEILLVCAILAVHYPWYFAGITAATLLCYVLWTILITNWRTHLRREANALDSAVNTRAIDSLLNYETVKYFNNEAFEAQRYDEQLAKWRQAETRSATSLSLLNVGQACIIAVGVTLMMWQAASGVAHGIMTLGDLVLVNAYLLQVYVPLNFLGVMYRELRQSITDIERLMALLSQNQEIRDRPDAKPLVSGPMEIRFHNVHFHYDNRQPVLHGVDFTIPPGKTYAVVGYSGAGKSTLSRLLFRFYDVSSGQILINGHDVRDLTQQSLRQNLGIVPQDTVLFDDSIYYNIHYGRLSATHAEVIAAAQAAYIMPFIESLPQGFDTIVGERGLKLSGGEKQRVAIARTLLKNPPILIFDEATSALDSQTERAIQRELERIAQGRATLVIAHRLSTIMNADCILVLNNGVIVEQGRHEQLLAQNGYYAHLWAAQKEKESAQYVALHTARNILHSIRE